MIYKYIALADIHWGAADSNILYNSLSVVLEFIRQAKDNLDFVVICGDYFDCRIQLNSKTAIKSIVWFDELVSTCREANVKKIRIVKGTHEHDNDQLEVLRASYEDDTGFVKIFNETTVEELLPGLKCIYCPDENMNNREYYRKYSYELMQLPDIGFIHGNVDSVLPSIEYDRITDNNLKKMIFIQSYMSSFIKGPIIAGHWHDPHDNNPLYYIGSIDRWKYNENGIKGFIYGEYDNITNKYFIHRIPNPIASEYITYDIMSSKIITHEELAKWESKITKELIENPRRHIRVVYYYMEENEEAKSLFYEFQKRFLKYKNTKIEFKDLVKKEFKKKKKEQIKYEESTYGYLFDDSVTIAQKIKNFIEKDPNKSIALEDITKRIDRYLSD